MFHGLYFEDGKVVRYRNRWARTRQWGVHHSSDHAGSMLNSNPNVNFVNHAGELLALGEGAIPLSINTCLLYTSPSPRDRQKSRMPSSA